MVADWQMKIVPFRFRPTVSGILRAAQMGERCSRCAPPVHPKRLGILPALR